jgi:protein-disulfide isomerase
MRSIQMRAVILGAVFAVLPPVILAAEPLTKEQGDAILNELRAIRGLLERPATPPAPTVMPENTAPVKVDIKGAYSVGRADAPVTVIAFIDYQCPFCKRFDAQTYPELKKRFIDSGKVRFVVQDLPLEMHPYAQKASEASYCAADQGKYWPMREKLIANTEKLEPAALAVYAREIGVKADAFKSCMSSGKHAPTVKRTSDQARELGISGTPTFVIAKGGGDSVTGVKLVGAMPFAQFEQRINTLLGGG